MTFIFPHNHLLNFAMGGFVSQMFFGAPKPRGFFFFLWMYVVKRPLYLYDKESNEIDYILLQNWILNHLRGACVPTTKFITATIWCFTPYSFTICTWSKINQLPYLYVTWKRSQQIIEKNKTIPRQIIRLSFIHVQNNNVANQVVSVKRKI